VRLGVQAPKHIAVHRQEVFQRIQMEQTVSEAETEAAKENGTG